MAASSVTGLRRHWLAAILLAAGLVFRILTLIAYRPALLYVDTLKYLYNAYPGADPVGYKVPLRLILAIGNLDAVAAIQHLLGLAIAVTLYAILLSRGTPRWLAAIAIVPVLLDAYQLQIEQTIMPDVWFEALIVAGIAVLLTVRASRATASPATASPATADSTRHALGARARGPIGAGLVAVIATGLILGVSATFRQVGEILILPALAFVVVLGGGWRKLLTSSVVLTAAFAIPIVAYSAGSYLINGHFWLASSTPSISSYGRMADAADCATLRLPAYQQALCPTPRQQAFGQDWLDHDAASPLKTFAAPAGMNRYAIIASFNRQVLSQQPERVLAAITRDTIKLFALTRTSSQGGTPISRWQFQDSYPTYPNWITVRNATIIVGLPQTDGSVRYQPLTPGYGGAARVSQPVAAVLRRYQLDGGYTPGPLMLLFALAGLAGSLLVLDRRGARRGRETETGRGTAVRHELTSACLLFFGCGATVLAMSDVFQFSWRYQLPALVTLPPAGALGIAALVTYLTRRSGRPAAEQRTELPELTVPAV